MRWSSEQAEGHVFISRTVKHERGTLATRPSIDVSPTQGGSDGAPASSVKLLLGKVTRVIRNSCTNISQDQEANSARSRQSYTSVLRIECVQVQDCRPSPSCGTGKVFKCSAAHQVFTEDCST